MNTEWESALKTMGAVIYSENDAELSDSDAISLSQFDGADSYLLMPLVSLRVVDVEGADANKFLQAQFCNDVSALADGTAQINGYCSPKGRLFAVFALYATSTGYRILMPDSVMANFIKRLRMYVLRWDVTFTERLDLVCTGVAMQASGSAAQALSEATAIKDLPAAPMSCAQQKNVDVIHWHAVPAEFGKSALARYVIVANVDTQLPICKHKMVRLAGSAQWRWGDIVAGVPSVVDATSEQFIPQMINLQLLDGLSFKKGCYPGQEIVARMQYLGKLKKNMRLFKSDGAADAVNAGDVITTETDNNAGMVVDAVNSEEGTYLLAVVNKLVHASDMRVAGQTLLQLDLPYSVPEE